MLKLGVLGLNEGNGHPYSYSAIFNGYDPQALERECPFPLIREYLPRDHGNRIFIADARVTHVWCQDRALAESVARVSRIATVVDKREDMVGAVDAVILARDDPCLHLEIARPFLEASLPLLIDKQLAGTAADIGEILRLSAPHHRFIAGSPMRYTRQVSEAAKAIHCDSVRSIHGTSRVSWMRYAHHLLEGIVPLWGFDFAWVRSLSSDPSHDIVQLQYRKGPSVILEFVPGFHLPIQFTCFSETQPPYRVPFEDFFFSFREMLLAFVRFVATGERPFTLEETLALARIVLAGDISKACRGEQVDPAAIALG